VNSLISRNREFTAAEQRNFTSITANAGRGPHVDQRKFFAEFLSAPAQTAQISAAAFLGGWIANFAVAEMAKPPRRRSWERSNHAARGADDQIEAAGE